MIDAGNEAYERGDYATALSEWRPLADQGDADAQFYLGRMYQRGYGVPQDNQQARHWWEKAAAQGLVDAQFNLGLIYENGEGVPQDLVQAHKWYNLAGVNGHKDAATQRDVLAKQMTPAQIAEAERLAREWKPTTP